MTAPAFNSPKEPNAMTVNCALVRDGTYPAILNHSQKINDNGAQANATLKIRNVAGKPLAGAAVFAQIESSIATIYRSRVDHRSASFALNETQAVEIAAALLGKGYAILSAGAEGAKNEEVAGHLRGAERIADAFRLVERIAAFDPDSSVHASQITGLIDEARRIVGSPA